jgi:hypothetical protein
MQHALGDERANDLVRCRTPGYLRQLVERDERAALAFE